MMIYGAAHLLRSPIVSQSAFYVEYIKRSDTNSANSIKMFSVSIISITSYDDCFSIKAQRGFILYLPKPMEMISLTHTVLGVF